MRRTPVASDVAESAKPARPAVRTGKLKTVCTHPPQHPAGKARGMARRQRRLHVEDDDQRGLAQPSSTWLAERPTSET